MAIQTEWVFFLVCDHCGERLSIEGWDYLVETTEALLIERATNSDWVCENGKWECDDCWESREAASTAEPDTREETGISPICPRCGSASCEGADCG